MLLMIVLLTLQVPSVKQYLAQEAVLRLSELTDHRVEVGEVQISWLDYASGKKIRLYDFNDSLMISAENASLNFDLLHLFEHRSIQLDDIVLDQAELNLTKYNDSTSLNLIIFLNTIKPKKDTIDTDRSLPILIQNIELENVTLNFNDQRSPRQEGEKLDLKHLAFQVREGYLHDFSILSDTIQFQVLTLKGKDNNSGLTIDDWATKVHIDGQHLVLAELDLVTPHSHIKDSIALSFSSFSNLPQFRDSVRMNIHLEDSDIGLEDLQYFANVENTLGSKVHITTQLDGTLSRLAVPILEVSLPSGTRVAGRVELIGLPDIDNTFVDLNISSGILKNEDLTRILGKYDFQQDIRIKGNFLGFFNDFVSSARFDTPYGDVVTDINFKIPENLKRAKYTGSLELIGVNVGKILGEEMLGTIDLQGAVEGAGLTEATADFYVDAKAQNLVFKEYTYDSLEVSGNFASRFFKGDFLINDPNCRVDGLGILDFTTDDKRLFAQVTVDSLKLQNLNLSSEKLNFHSSISLNVKGLDLDEATGKVEFINAFIENEQGAKSIRNLKLSASREGNERKYELESPGLRGDLTGRFLPSALIKDIPLVASSYYELLTRDRSGEFIIEDSLLYDSLDNYEWDLKLDIKEINSLLELVGPPITISNNSLLEVSFRKSKNVNLSVYAEVDTFGVQSNELYAAVLDVSASRDIDSPDVLAIIQLSSESQNWSDKGTTESLSIESTWFNNTINSQFRVTEPSLDDRVVLNSEVTYLRDSILIKLLPSRINLLGNRWVIDSDNYLSWDEKRLHLNEMKFQSEGQILDFSGVISQSSATNLDFRFENFSLDNFNPFLSKNLTGQLDAQGTFIRTPEDSLIRVSSDVKVTDLFLDDVEMGSLQGFSRWDSDQSAILMDYKILRKGVNTIELSGKYFPLNQQDQLDLEVEFDQAALSMAEPFLENLFSGISGTISGRLNIGGQTNSPTFYGSGKVNQGKALFNYTKATYTFDGIVDFDSYEIAFRGLDITDGLNGRGKIFGSIYHEQLRNIQLAFNANFRRLQMLNTTAVDSDVYYGRAYGSGNLKLSGPVSQLTLDAQITTESGTRIFFPLASSASVAQEDFITFVDPNEDPNPEEVQERQRNASGMSIQMDMNVTPDAYAELIFDAQSGDILRGRTQGNLQFRMNPNGEFNLLGGLEIKQGAYNFTVPGINKEFVLEEGGTISWVGDPYQGMIDLKASYRQVATLTQWDPSFTNTSKIPFLVVLGLKGSMLQPEISFEIQTADDLTIGPGVESRELRRFLVSTNDREDELNRQVFSLLMLRKLSPQNSFVVGGVGRGISGSVSELLANQLSYWLSQSNENLEVDIDLAGLDQDAFNTFQYRLAYTFLDGRLRVSGGNSLNNQVTGAEVGFNDSNNNLIGNWAVEYLLSPDGRWRAKFFSRTSQNLTTNSENNQQTGISFQYIRSFDQFRQLIKKSREDEEPPIQLPEPKEQTSAKAN